MTLSAIEVNNLKQAPTSRACCPSSTAAGARHHSNGFDIGVHADLLLEPFRLVHQRLVGDVLLALHVALQAPGILLREKPFGDFVVKVDVNAQGN